MNQDNIFNNQDSNGIPNNQPLQNNQSLNNAYNQNMQQSTNVSEQTFNSQPQNTPNYQQPINQMNIQEPTPQPINTFESENTNNQNSNSKPPKKTNLGLIIGIIIVVIVAITVAVLLLNNPSNNNSTVDASSNSSSDNSESSNVEMMNIENPSVTILGKEYTFPVPYKEFASNGWKVGNKNNSNPKVEYEWKDYVVNGDKIIKLYCTNLTGKTTTLDNCHVTGFLVEEEDIVMNVEPGDIKVNNVFWLESSYSDAYKVFGPDYHVWTHLSSSIDVDINKGIEDGKELLYNILPEKDFKCMLSMDFLSKDSTLNYIQYTAPTTK